jgi:hypothetical protein
VEDLAEKIALTVVGIVAILRGMSSASDAPRDVRFGHDLAQVQDENGVDLLLLKRQLELTVEERLLRLEQHQQFVASSSTICESCALSSTT